MSEKPLVSFDYAIKYLLKDKGDYEILEGFISAVLKSIGYDAVKIVSLFDTESNTEEQFGKRSLADLIVEDVNHHKYIVEIERNITHTFIPKAYFNTSRLVVDHLGQGIEYHNIIKVFHISLLYFSFGQDVMYHGKTEIEGIELHDKLHYPIVIPETGELLDAVNFFAEYFFISIPSFNDRLEKEIDEWLYVMKHDAIPPNFQSSYMQRVEQRLNILKMTKAERDAYIYYQKKLCEERDKLHAARSEGREESESMIVKAMIEEKLSVDEISKYTKLPIEKIRSFFNR